MNQVKPTEKIFIDNGREFTNAHLADATSVASGTGIHLPGAWYDLSVRIDAARSVASCAMESLPYGLQGLDYVRINETGNLIAALTDLLDLCAEDVNLTEQQLNERTKPA